MSPKVKFKDTGDEVEVKAGTPLKDVSRGNGWPIAFGCEDGVCGTCLVEILEGKENLSPREEVESQTLDMMCMKDQKHRLACQCKVNGDVKIKGM